MSLERSITDLTTSHFFLLGQNFINEALEHPQYPDYMAFVLITNEIVPPIGVLAVQLMKYNQLKQKVRVVISDINQYLYLSWIALGATNRNVNYFAILFDFYQVLIRKLRLELHTRIEGAAPR